MKFVQLLVFGLSPLVAVDAAETFPHAKRQWLRFPFPLNFDPIKGLYDFKGFNKSDDYYKKGFLENSLTNFWNAAPDDYLKKHRNIPNIPGAWLADTEPLNEVPMENAKYFVQYHNSKFTHVYDHPICDAPLGRTVHRINLYRESLQAYEIPCISCDHSGKTMYFMVDASPMDSNDLPKWVEASEFFEKLRHDYNLKYTPAEQIGEKPEQPGEKAEKMKYNQLDVGSGILGNPKNQLDQLIYELNRPRDFICTDDPHKFMNKPSVIVIRSDYLYPKQPTFGRADEWYIEYASVVKTETPPDPDYDLNLEKVTIWNEWSCCTSCSTKPQTSEIITRTGMCSIRKLDPQIPIHIPADDAKNEASRIFKQWKRFDDLLTNEIDYKEKGIPCFSTLLWIEFDEIRTGLMKRFLSRETKNDKAGFYLQTDECSHDQYECMETRNACLKKEQQKEEEPFLAADTSKHIPAVPFVVPTQPPIKLTSPKTSTKTKRRKPPTTNEPQTSVPKWAWISGSIVATATLLGILFAVLYRTGALKCLKQRSGSESENETKK